MHRDTGIAARSGGTIGRTSQRLLIVGLAGALVTGACTGDGGSGGPTNGAPERIPQPVVSGLPIAPEGERVDVAMPSFSNPTRITNPLFPVSLQESVLLLGRVDGKPFRTEVTLLPDTRIIEWEGRRVATLVSQYVAYLGGRIHEVAYDFYAQADDGSVWYFGEDVFNFHDGVIVDTHGTWIAGKDGPAAMIMPANPKVGDVYRPENIPGFVFEEVTVKSVGQTLAGPLGVIDGGLVIEELHMDGNTEAKTFAPGYGEFYTAGGGDVEALALAVPTDASPGLAPEELVILESGATGVFDDARSGDWRAATATIGEMLGAWERFRSGEAPDMIAPRMASALRSLAAAVDVRDPSRARRAAIGVGQWALDLQLRHRPPAEIDLSRFDLWAAQLMVDASAGDPAAVNGDLFTLDYIRDRILHVMDGPGATAVNLLLEELLSAVGDADFAAAVDTAGRLRQAIAEIEPPA